MTYDETLEYLYNKLPMFQRLGAPAYNKDLMNTIRMCDALGNPQNRFRSVHIGGTNGKGSVTHFVASVLQEHGLKVGIYCSPHYVDFRERMKINGKLVDKDFVVDFVEEYKDTLEDLKLTFFEMTVGMAFTWFAMEKVDIAIVEVGMGGRLDSTNVIHPLLTVITNVSNDHMQFLGNSLQEIAFEKSGIIKRRVPSIIGERCPETEQVFIDKAANRQSSLTFASDIYDCDLEDNEDWNSGNSIYKVSKNGEVLFESIELNAMGSYQCKNFATSLHTLDMLESGTNGFKLDLLKIKAGLKNISKNTAFMGRWQVIQTSPLVVCESAHNEAGFKELAKQLQKKKFEKIHFVFGTVADKDLSLIFPHLPTEAKYYLSNLSIPRGKKVDVLAEEFGNNNFNYVFYDEISTAYNTAFQSAGAEDIIVIGGSIFAVADFLTYQNSLSSIN